MKEDDFVIATRPINGIPVDSVGVIKSMFQEEVLVYFPGENEEVVAPLDSLSVINVDRTGDQHPDKICNICYILKPTEKFRGTLTNAKGRRIRLPSCDKCRKVIDGKKLPTAERRKMDAEKPPDKSVFVCPICKKTSDCRRNRKNRS